MSGNDYNLFWIETIRQLIEEGRLSEQEHDMWFRNMDFLKGDVESITLSVPSNFYRDQVVQRYMNLLENKIHELTGSPMNIGFEIIKKTPEEERNEKPKSRKIEAEKQKSSETAIPADTAPNPDRSPHQQLRQDYAAQLFHQRAGCKQE